MDIPDNWQEELMFHDWKMMRIERCNMGTYPQVISYKFPNGIHLHALSIKVDFEKAPAVMAALSDWKPKMKVKNKPPSKYMPIDCDGDYLGHGAVKEELDAMEEIGEEILDREVARKKARGLAQQAAVKAIEVVGSADSGAEDRSKAVNSAIEAEDLARRVDEDKIDSLEALRKLDEIGKEVLGEYYDKRIDEIGKEVPKEYDDEEYDDGMKGF